MKTNLNRIAILAVALFVGVQCAHAQGTFQNLRFENPVPPLDQWYVPITNALPGWTGYIGSNQAEWVFYNTISIGGAAISLQGPGSVQPILQGSYTVFLQGEYNPDNVPGFTTSAAIAQTGQIPATAQSLIFWASIYGSATGLQIMLNGQPIPYIAMGSGPNYTIWGTDVSSFAGQTATLNFTAPYNISVLLDNIRFSTDPIPEPSTLGLFAFGALLLGWHLRRKHKP